MRIGVIGAGHIGGHIGGNIARHAVRVGHEVALSFSHDPATLLPGARYTQCFNTLTSAFQARTAQRLGAQALRDGRPIPPAPEYA